ncbi:uncharacterized protein LOC132200973 [Neocloeon triangulifer]|uniref:uncharacterized protein LOC132200973 n=1 Tax=Neocloeon triangulifer TaxID=2078957 RepID=UPI00286F1020|nr:uncharacterized protein LOC132200973 [Neocloeon triangulifer]
MLKHIRILSFWGLMTLVASGAVRNDARPTSGSLVKFEDQQQQAAEEKVMSPYGTSGGVSSAPMKTVYKPMKFDGSSGGAAAAASANYPYNYEEAAPASTFHAATYNEPPYHYGGKTAYISPHKFGHGKFDVHNGLSHNSPWRKIIRVLTAAIPIGLFLAALPPNVVNINATQSVKPLGTFQKQRSTEEGPVIESFPVLDMIESRGGLRALEDADCEANLFCEIARLGREANANSVQRGFWSVVNDTPDALSELLGVKELFKAIRTDACQIYKCPTQKNKE